MASTIRNFRDLEVWQLGKKIVANVVILGYFTAVTDVVNYDAMKKAIPDSVPEKAIDLNMQAFERGYNYGLERLKKQKDA